MRSRYGVSIGNIIHPTDFSHGSDVAFAHALRLAVGCKGRLEILHVERGKERAEWDNYPSVRGMLAKWGLLPKNAQRRDVAALGVDISKSACTGTDEATGVLAHIEQRGADLVVLATHQREGLDRWMHRSLAENVSNRTDAATLFVPYGVDGFVDFETGAVSLKSVIVSVDSHPDSQVAVDAVSDLVAAIADDAVEIHLLHVGDPADVPGLTPPANEHCQWVWDNRSGSVVDVIGAEAQQHNADLIVMTTNGHDGFLDAVRGSTTERVLHQCRCPLLAVHEAEN